MNVWQMTTYQVNSSTDNFLHIKTLEDLWKVEDIEKEVIIFWGWSNLLLLKENIKDKYFVKYDLEWKWEKTWEDNENFFFDIYAGENISKFISKSLEYTNIFNPIYWLPGNIAWAIMGNTWSFWTHMGEFIEKIYWYNFISKKFINIKKEDLKFSHRKLSIKYSLFLIIKANIRVPKNYKYDIKHYLEYARERIKFQPIGNSCGKYFLNPEISIEKAEIILKTQNEKEELWEDIYNYKMKTISTKRLIEQAWLSGYSKKWVQISKLHPNFIMNIWTNNGQDIYDMGNYIKKTIKEKFDIDLIEEVRIIQ